MDDYKPLNISDWCNAGPSIIDAEAIDVIGENTFRGLPFLVGSNEIGNCYISLSGSDNSISIPVNKNASRIIFAHRLMGSDLGSGGPLGVQVAEYVLYLSGGVEIRVPIRERFEIGLIGGKMEAQIRKRLLEPGVPIESIESPIAGIPGFPGTPFLAVPDQKAKLHPRYSGPWVQAGRRQTEAEQETAQHYYLYAWQNPEPTRQIESIQIIPNGLPFIIAAITLGELNEHPFSRDSRLAARITLTNEANSEKEFESLDVEVNRGDTTYVFPLPKATPEEFLTDPYSWGQQLNRTSSPSYVEVSAIPSATLTVKQEGENIGSVNWGQVLEKGAAATKLMRVELVDPGKNWVHVKVLDDETGRPVPCRVHFRSPEGIPFQPHGHHNQVNSNIESWHNDVGGDLRLGQTSFAFIDGTCQGWLPRGEVYVDISRGFEYEPIRSKVTIEPGQQELTLRIKRWINMNRDGWYSGDSHVHFLSPQGAHREAQAEDLDVVNLLQSQWGSLFTNTEDFIGKPNVSTQGDSIVYVGQENRQHFMGHMILWGLKKPIMPWCSDGLGEAEIGGSMETTLSEWADRCHEQGGWVVQPHFPNPNGEAAALVATGRLDGIEMIRQTAYNHSEYYRYLNCGYRLPIVGGTDKMSNEVPVGLYRTYAKLVEGEEFTYENWCNSVSSGRTFLSGGPIIGLSIDGHSIGDTVNISSNGTVEVQAWAESIFPIHRLEIVQAGKVVASTQSTKGARRLEINEKLQIDTHTWIAARCGGPGYFGPNHIDAMNRGIFAHTSPIYIACGGDWWMFDHSTAQYMLTMIDGDLSYIRDTSNQHSRDNVTHHHSKENHIDFLEHPFHEAKEAILNRMRKLGITL